MTDDHNVALIYNYLHTFMNSMYPRDGLFQQDNMLKLPRTVLRSILDISANGVTSMFSWYQPNHIFMGHGGAVHSHARFWNYKYHDTIKSCLNFLQKSFNPYGINDP